MRDVPQPRFPWAVASCAVFFVLFFLYIWLVIDTRVLYEMHPRFPVFFTGATFFKTLMTRYGGPLEYVSGFLAQSYHFAWLGALVITATTALSWLALDVIIRAMGGNHVRFTALIPAAIVLVAHNHGLNQITVVVGLLVALAVAALYVRVRLENDLARVALFLALSLPLYFAAAGAFLLFAVVAGLFELLARRRRLPALVAFLSVEAVPYFIGTYVLQVGLMDAYAYLLPYHVDTSGLGREVVVWAYVLPPVLVVAIGVWRRAAARREARGGKPASRPTGTPGRAGKRAPSSRRRGAPRQPAVAWLLLLALTAGAVVLTYDRHGMAALRIDHYARCRMWETVLSAAQALPLDHYNRLVAQHVNQALYQTERLPDEMFRYPQYADGMLFDTELSQSLEAKDRKKDAVNDLYFRIGDIELQLGLVNDAEHQAHEALAIHGQHPTVLRRLALINIIKEQPEAARVFLRTLRRDLIYGGEADAILQRLETDPYLSSDPEIQRLRSAMLLEDEAGLDSSRERNYQALLRSNAQNRMAFEYLMAFYLLTSDLDRFAENLPRLRDLGYAALPRHYQEAILLYERDTTKRADRCGYKISDAVLQQFARFSRDAELCGTVTVAAQALRREHSNTYYYYHLTGLSGLGDQRIGEAG